MPDLDRRAVIRGAAWSLPVIALAVATPLAAASGQPGCSDRAHLYRPQDYSGNGSMGPNHNVAEILVTGSAVIITYRKPVDLVDINVHKPSGSVNRHENRRVAAGESITIPLVDCEDPTFIQVHGNNAHYYGGGVFR